MHKEQCAERGEEVPDGMVEWEKGMLRTAAAVDTILKGELERLTEMWEAR